MKDRDFLLWIHDRLLNVHNEPHDIDYMGKLRSIISEMPIEAETANVAHARDTLTWTREMQQADDTKKGSVSVTQSSQSAASG